MPHVRGSILPISSKHWSNMKDSAVLKIDMIALQDPSYPVVSGPVIQFSNASLRGGGGVQFIFRSCM